MRLAALALLLAVPAALAEAPKPSLQQPAPKPADVPQKPVQPPKPAEPPKAAEPGAAKAEPPKPAEQPEKAATDRPASTGGAGKVTGKVTIAGLAPKLPPLPVTKDAKICGVNKADEALVIGTGGGIKNAVVWIPGVAASKDAAAKKVRIEQQGCRFEPHVAVATAGATLELVNSDRVLHHPRAQPASVPIPQQGAPEKPENNLWDFAMPLKGHTVPRKLDKPQTVRITCDAHPWMRAYVQVLDSAAFAVTDDLGNFTIAGVPAGKHKLKLWHERLGEREESVDVSSGETATKNVTLAPR